MLDLVLEKIFYVGVGALILGVLLFLLQVICVRILRFSSERAWTLKIWPASLVALGIIGLTLPAAVTKFAPPPSWGAGHPSEWGAAHHSDGVE